ncbi:22018_t:CDS:2, partial [Gigaspora margarita]
KLQTPVLPKSNYFKACLKNWQKPCIVPCSAEFKAMDEDQQIFLRILSKLINIHQYLYLCTGKVKSTRQIDWRLPLILVINVTRISIIAKEIYLENKDIPEEINFPLEDKNHTLCKELQILKAISARKYDKIH